MTCMTSSESFRASKKVKRCLECAQRHRPCLRKNTKLMCDNCQQYGLECVTVARRKPYRTGKRIEQARAHFGDNDSLDFSTSHSPDGKAEDRSSPPLHLATQSPGQVTSKLTSKQNIVAQYPLSQHQNLRPSSSENVLLRKREMNSSLTMCLMAEGTRKISALFRHKALDLFSGTCHDEFASSIPDFFASFLNAGMNPLVLNHLGKTKVALFTAVGSLESRHSAVVGSPMQHLRERDRLSAQAVLRDRAVVTIWKHFIDAWEDHERHRSSDTCYEEFTLLASVATFMPGFWLPEQRFRFHRRALKYFLRFYQTLDKIQQTSWFEFFLTEDARHAMTGRNYPCLSDNIILEFKGGKIVDPQIFLSWNLGWAPRPSSNLGEHIETCWGTMIGLERTVAVVTACEKNFSRIELTRIVQKLFTMFDHHQEWRRNTCIVWRDENGRDTNLTPFGKEDPVLISDEFARQARSLYTILDVIMRREEQSNHPDDALRQLISRAKSVAGLLISRLYDLNTNLDSDWDELARSLYMKEPVRALDHLPCGLGYLAQYLEDALPSTSELERRVKIVQWIASYYRRHSSEGGAWMNGILKLERGLAQRSLLISISGLAQEMVSAAVQEISM